MLPNTSALDAVLARYAVSSQDSEEITTSLESSSSVSAVSEEWPEPRPIRSELLPVEPLPLAIIPESYQGWLSDAAHRMQCPLDFLATAAIVMTGAIVGAGCGIKPKRQDDWLVIPNLWGGVVGRPSMLKTPAISEALRPMTQLEAQAKESFIQKQREYEAELEIYKAQREGLTSLIKKNIKNTSEVKTTSLEDFKRDLLQLPEPKKPVWRRYKTNDASIEKMRELLAENPRGLLIFRDELVGLLSSWDREGHESDRAFYLEAWNGYGSITTDRIGRGTIHAENLCVSVFGGIQPTKLLAYLHQAMKGFNNDGLVQRLQLLVYPDEPKTWQLIDQHPNRFAKQRAFAILEKLAAMQRATLRLVRAVSDAKEI